MLPHLAAIRPWADPEIVALHRLPMHVPLPLGAGADVGRQRRSLNGRWQFRLFGHPDAVPPSAITGSAARWQTVAVPGSWTMHDVSADGIVDLPHYTNIVMPFDGPPPRLPERVPTGVYRRELTVPAAWCRAGTQTVLHVGGAESVHAVWLNGAFVGYGTDSKLASEYDVSAAVRPGRNELAIVVVRYSAQSYVEDQDQWWMGGLHREVYLESRPAVHVADVRCVADYDHVTGAGTLDVDVHVGWAIDPQAGCRTRVSLQDPKGRRVGRAVESVVPHVAAAAYFFEGFFTRHHLDMTTVQPWSAEQPTRYTVRVELLDASGAVVDSTHQRIGFRRVEIRDRALRVNGQPVWIFGVNRHDHHPDRGITVTVDDMRADLHEMRRHNITAVRTSHYPNDPTFLDLCDEIGMYVWDESNIESHAYNRMLCDDARWRSTWVSRGSRMVERDRNHPSVLVWSLGNESGYGANHDALAGWMRRADPTRPLHYEGATFHGGWTTPHPATDIVCPMYPPIWTLQYYGESMKNPGANQQPLIMCEYSHAMGNSNGSLADYWNAITSTTGVQGGFVWEWKDHGLRQRLPDGSTRLAYGGQFGDEPNDANFVADGVVGSEGDPHPAMRELMWVYRPVTVTAGRRGRLRIANRRSFTTLDDLRATYELLVDGEVRARGPLALPTVAPHSTVDVPMPCEVPADAIASGAEVMLTIRCVTRRAQPWAAAGHLVAWDQVLVRAAARTHTVASPVGTSDGVERLLAQPPQLTLWRAPLDNDGLKMQPATIDDQRTRGVGLGRWLELGLDVAPAERLVDHRCERIVTDAGIEFHHTVVVPESLTDLPRVGIEMHLPGRFTQLRWYGRGPHENYPDRNSSALLGVWDGAPDDMPYLMPQEFALRTDCRWFEFIDPKRREVLRLDVLRPTTRHAASLHCSATHHTAADLYTATTATELRPRRQLVVHVDAAHRGVGTASCGPDTLPQYLVGPGTYRFSYRLARRTLR